MFGITLSLLVGVFVWDFTLCSITCPDGNTCTDFNTCCETQHGYSCCPYPDAVCCSDLAHCCPSGFRCNLTTQMCVKKKQSWMNIPMVKKEAAEKPSIPVLPVSSLQELKNSDVPEQQEGPFVRCDSFYVCPGDTTCCRHPGGVWFCCPYIMGRCCLDGYHCCPFGYVCDLTYTHCLRQSLRYPFTPKHILSSFPASLISTSEEKNNLEETSLSAVTEANVGTFEVGVIRCDSKFYCPQGKTCCKASSGQWNCCPYPLGQCCGDGKHCCQYGYNCDPSSLSCRRWYSQIPSGKQERANTD